MLLYKTYVFSRWEVDLDSENSIFVLIRGLVFTEYKILMSPITAR